MKSKPSRRDIIIGAAATAVTPIASSAKAFLPMSKPSGFHSILRSPDLVRAFDAENHELKLENLGNGTWSGGAFEITIQPNLDESLVSLKGGDQVSRIQVRWKGDFRAIKRYLGDHWERSYADLEWRGEVPGRTMPWFFMAFDGHRTHGYGVKTGPKAFCFWNADVEGISLWFDVRSGGLPVKLGSRTLEMATIVCREGKEQETAFQAQRAFCRQMCPNPRLTELPVYGTNDWNYAYGNNSAELIGNVADLISELSPNQTNRPYSVIDEGWAMGPYENRFGHGPWVGNPRFGDMAKFAEVLKGKGVHPGLWYRPLTPLPGNPEKWLLARSNEFLDPTIPEVLDQIRKHIQTFGHWGYELVKHDFTTWDVCGQWGFQMGPNPTQDGWSLHDKSKTTMEALAELYQTIRHAAGPMKLIGCNTVSHVAVGYHELQRTGDDTSGRSWNRNRRMGVNTLAFRAAHQGTFYEVDPDIVSITKTIPWQLVEQWLKLVSESGTALFVAMDPSIVESKHKIALKRALDIASRRVTIGEPLDWMDRDCPREWNLLGKKVEFNWMGDNGSWPFGD